jgi:hypothetical protein
MTRSNWVHLSRVRSAAAFGCLTVLLGLLAAGCGQSPPSPGEIVQSYEAALAEGNYAGACGYLDPSARTSLARLLGRRATCAQAIARCLPDKATIPKQDQSELFYANVQATVRGSTALVSVSGNPVANAIREVSLANQHTGWILTSSGKGLKACHTVRRRRPGRPVR